MTMKITVTVTATQEERLKVIHTAICNTWLFYNTLRFKRNQTLHNETRIELQNSGRFKEDVVCFEDILVKMVADGAVIHIIDTEDDDIVGELSLAKIEKNWDKIDSKDLIYIINENEDADTADNILQYITLGNIVYS